MTLLIRASAVTTTFSFKDSRALHQPLVLLSTSQLASSLSCILCISISHAVETIKFPCCLICHADSGPSGTVSGTISHRWVGPGTWTGSFSHIRLLICAPYSAVTKIMSFRGNCLLPDIIHAGAPSANARPGGMCLGLLPTRSRDG